MKRRGERPKPRRRKACFRFARPVTQRDGKIVSLDGALHWVPDNFPAVFGAIHLRLVDNVIMQLIEARDDLDDPEVAPRARALIDLLVQAIGGFGDPGSTLRRHELTRTVCPAYWAARGTSFASGASSIVKSQSPCLGHTSRRSPPANISERCTGAA